MRYAARRDVNHNPIESVFRQMLGNHVTDSSRWADGAGDLFVSWCGVHYFVEIKRDAKAEYTAHQVRFRNTHPTAVLRCESEEQAVELCKLIRQRAIILAGATNT